MENLTTPAANPKRDLPKSAGNPVLGTLRYLRDPVGYCTERMRRDGTLAYQFVSNEAGDHAPVEAILDGVRRAVV